MEQMKLIMPNGPNLSLGFIALQICDRKLFFLFLRIVKWSTRAVIVAWFPFSKT